MNAEDSPEIDPEIIVLALKRLTPLHQWLFWADRLHEMKRDDIAAELDLSVQEVDQHMREMIASFCLAVDDLQSAWICARTCN